jgi:hypothetical protein
MKVKLSEQVKGRKVYSMLKEKLDKDGKVTSSPNITKVAP